MKTIRFINNLKRYVMTLLSSLFLCAAIVPHASAHLMVAQKGTLNFKDDGAFMVLSLPVSAFENIDDDEDGKMSKAEFTKHRPTIINTVKERVLLTDKNGQRPLQGIILSPVVPHNDPQAASEQVVIMGRFLLANKSSENTDGLTFNVDLFGNKTEEQTLSINATRKLTSNSNILTFTTKLSPEKNTAKLFTK